MIDMKKYQAIIIDAWDKERVVDIYEDEFENEYYLEINSGESFRFYNFELIRKVGA